MPSVEGLLASVAYPPYKAPEDKCMNKDGTKMFPDTGFFSDSLLFAPVQAQLKDIFVNIPGCSYESYALKGEACQLKANVINGHDIGVTVKQCPNSALPFVSVTCHGPFCESVGVPCDVSSDCAAGVCVTVFSCRMGVYYVLQ